jgi:CheY-like chemotaxis protein
VRILLVEDDASSSEGMRDLLETAGHSVDCASNGREALERLRDERPYCLILLDVRMPVMNGYEFRDAQLKDPRFADIPVIMLTADGHAREKARRLRTDQFFQKPFSPPELLRAIDRHCPTPQAKDASASASEPLSP